MYIPVYSRALFDINVEIRKPKNTEVQKWLDELKQFDTEKFRTTESARKIVFAEYPNVSERIIYGGIMFTLEKDFGGLFVSKKHVSFEFTDGYIFKDPKKLLEGAGKFRRHLKLKDTSDVEHKEVSFFVRQVVK